MVSAYEGMSTLSSKVTSRMFHMQIKNPFSLRAKELV